MPTRPAGIAMVDSGSTVVTLREITAETVRIVTRLAVLPEQRGFVATNAESLAQALFSGEAWYRAIYAGDTPAGFVMLYDESLRSPPPPMPQIAVWRFMIDAQFQRRGIGTAAMRAVVAHVREKGVFDTLELSYVPGPDSPEPFYRRAGFAPTGRVDEGEIVLELQLAPSSSDAGAGSGPKTERHLVMTAAVAPEFKSTFVVLEPDLSAVMVAVTPTVFADLDTRFDHCRGRVLISSFAFDTDWSTWEMHPHGDEIVCLLEGDVHVVLDQDGIESVLHLAKPGAFAIVPRGTWHTARTSVPTNMLFVTPCEGTVNRPA